MKTELAFANQTSVVGFAAVVSSVSVDVDQSICTRHKRCRHYLVSCLQLCYNVFHARCHVTKNAKLALVKCKARKARLLSVKLEDEELIPCIEKDRDNLAQETLH
jgi:hypothetical protein